MGDHDPFRRFLAWALPWFNREHDAQEQATVDRAVELSEQAVRRTNVVVDREGVRADIARRYERHDRVLRR